MARQLLVALAVVAVLASGVAGAAAGPGPAETGLAVAQQGEQCDFDRLYDDTIPSVVTVRVWNERGDVALGSGWVYEANESRALVVTNWHVVERSLGGDVQFSDGQWRRIDELVGVDFFSDLAVLSVEDPPANVSALPVASDRLDQGEEVVAFGSPLGLEGSITRGIVSAVNRSIAVQNRTIANAVQIDTPISPGSSGGPLVDCGGDVVGVNFAGVTGEDVNFAISSAMVRQVVPAIVENGTYNHSYLGVRGVTLSPTMARVNGLNRSQGVLVVSTVAGAPASIVLRGSPATERVTGIPVGGDVIVAVDGTPTPSEGALAQYLFRETRPGETVTLTVVRGGERLRLAVELGQRSLPRERTPSI